MLEVASHALTLERVDALSFVRVEEHLFDRRRLRFGEISRSGIRHRHIHLAGIILHCAFELRAACKHVFRLLALPSVGAVDGG